MAATSMSNAWPTESRVIAAACFTLSIPLPPSGDAANFSRTKRPGACCWSQVFAVATASGSRSPSPRICAAICWPNNQKSPPTTRNNASTAPATASFSRRGKRAMSGRAIARMIAAKTIAPKVSNRIWRNLQPTKNNPAMASAAAT